MGGSRRIFLKQVAAAPCPADNLTPNRVDCGLATFIDRQLAGDFGRDDRLYRLGPYRRGKPQLGYQLPLTPEQFFKAGSARRRRRAAAGSAREASTTRSSAPRSSTTSRRCNKPGVPWWRNEPICSPRVYQAIPDISLAVFASTRSPCPRLSGGSRPTMWRIFAGCNATTGGAIGQALSSVITGKPFRSEAA
jgi:hypothetical protein